MEEINIPLWLHYFEEYRLDDEVRAVAYEKANAVHKAGIKSAIALHFKTLEEFYPQKTQCEKSLFTLTNTKVSSLSSCFVIGGDFNSPALFIAAIMPALLAKSSLCLVFRQVPNKDILLCLELLGLEQVFCIEADEVLINFISHFNENEALLTCFYFGTNGKEEIEKHAREKNISFYNYSSNPVILAGKNKELYKKIYPNAKILENVDEIEKNRAIDIVSEDIFSDILNADLLNKSKKYLILGDGLEFYHEALFDEKYFIKEQKYYTFAK